MPTEKNKVASTRVTQEEYDLLESLAQKRGTSVNKLLYDCVVKLIGGKITPSVGTVTEEVLAEYLTQLKADLIQELNSQQQPQVKPSQQEPSDGNKLSGAELCKRLGCYQKTLWRWRDQGKLQQKTKERDPDGKPWKYDPDDKIYITINPYEGSS